MQQNLNSTKQVNSKEFLCSSPYLQHLKKLEKNLGKFENGVGVLDPQTIRAPFVVVNKDKENIVEEVYYEDYHIKLLKRRVPSNVRLPSNLEGLKTYEKAVSNSSSNKYISSAETFKLYTTEHAIQIVKNYKNIFTLSLSGRPIYNDRNRKSLFLYLVDFCVCVKPKDSHSFNDFMLAFELAV
jgi:hypothetical protein